MSRLFTNSWTVGAGVVGNVKASFGEPSWNPFEVSGDGNPRSHRKGQPSSMTHLWVSWTVVIWGNHFSGEQKHV